MPDRERLTEMQNSGHNDPASSVARILAVVVVYKTQPCHSHTMKSLLQSAANVSSDKLNLRILAWDNTPGGQDSGEIPAGVMYEAAPHNPGLAEAYNNALKLARTEGYDWLLTLDQDSVLPINFLDRIADLARELHPQTTIGAIVPQVTSDGRNISPHRFLFGTIPHWFDYGFVGVPRGIPYAVNSGATLRVDALCQIGGYDPMFPLDLSDTNIFHCLHQAGKSVFIAGDLLVHHSVALLKKHERMSIARYHASLLDDCAFWDMHMGPVARLERIIKLAGRTCRDLFVPTEAAFHQATISELKRRLFKPRRQRIAEWQAWALMRHNNSATAPEDLLHATTEPSAQLSPLATSHRVPPRKPN